MIITGEGSLLSVFKAWYLHGKPVILNGNMVSGKPGLFMESLVILAGNIVSGKPGYVSE